MTAELAAMSRGAKIFAFASMCVGMFIALLDIQIVSASLRDIGGGLSAGADDTAWVQTSYLIAEIVVIPLSGWLSQVMSTRVLFAFSAAGFTLASLLCGLAWNIDSMIAFRALQGLLGGSMIPLVFTTAFMFFQGKERVIAAATIGALASLAPTLGPTLGGWITDNFSWHWLFYVNLVPGAFITIVVPMLVKVDHADWSLLRGGDYLGIALMSTFLGCLEYTLEEGPRWNWTDDATIRTTAWITGVASVLFIWRELTTARPVVDLRALKDRNFALGCFFSFVTGIGLFATIYLTPLFLGRVEGYSALQIGRAVFTTGVFQVLTIPLYSALSNRVDARWVLMAGLALFALSMLEFTPITHDWGADQLLLPQALRGMGQQLAVPPTVMLTLGGLAPARLKLASGLFNLMRNLGGAIGIAGCATLLTNRTNLHFYRLAEGLTPANETVNALLANAGAGAQDLQAQASALKQLWLLTFREAQTLTYSDAFFTIMACFVVTTAMVPLMRKVVPPKGPSADAHGPPPAGRGGHDRRPRLRAPRHPDPPGIPRRQRAGDPRCAEAPPPLDAWWNGFDDPVLTRIVDRVIAQNLDLAASTERVAQARAVASRASASRLPDAGLDGQVARERQSLRSPLGKMASSLPGYGREQTLSSLGAGASWETDLAGGLRRDSQAASAEVDAAEAAHAGVRVSLVAEAADAYFRKRGARARIAIAEEQIGNESSLAARWGCWRFSKKIGNCWHREIFSPASEATTHAAPSRHSGRSAEAGAGARPPASG